ncbi:MAG TPA: serine/threonine-protein kinase [Deinococcales bacterium]|nr:serine/threonine-protein kinase [Deinococcales bacterium]
MSLAGTLVLDRYRIVRPFARGASSVVYLAFDEFGKPFAVKLFHAGLAARADREFLVAQRLVHPNLNRAVARVVVEGLPGVLLEFAPGVRLSDWPGKNGGPDELVPVLRGVVAGLAQVHALGFVHRDLKPENVIVHDAQGLGRRQVSARVVDFDLSGPSGEVFRDPVAPGTVAFISPEAALGKPLTPASDLYSLGVLAYWALAGRLPFDGEPREVLRAHAYSAPDQAPLARHGELGDLTARLLAKAPADRPHGLQALDVLNRMYAPAQAAFAT